MPRRFRRSTRRPRRAIRRRYPRRVKRTQMKLHKSLNAMKDIARVVESTEIQTVAGLGGNVWHQLNDFKRALSVSKNFRFFRCTRVELEFIPYANVFAPGTSFPELYYQIDRTIEVPRTAGTISGPGIPDVPTKASMLARGVLPKKWTSPILKFYTPSVLRQENLVQNVALGNVISVAGLAGTPVKNKWYNTESYFAAPPNNAPSQAFATWNPSFLTYFGAVWFIDTPVLITGPIGTLKMRTHWEFKEPLATPAEYPDAH